ncbi:MAG: AmmeMemoRadiSam system radical SAM enzyme [Armatimonadetes bacterium]|nr:AmmeMemoRadiSam system radical SAM enzyme [Armatimonadota bacterium]
MRTADAPQCRYWQRRDEVVECLLCPWHCKIKPGATGRCGVRYNDAGTLRCLTYGRVTAVNLDPIEKKPLYHFHPGEPILSIGSWGCNLSCVFCQNWSISQQRAPTQDLSPQQAVRLAEELRSRGNFGISYTYNEPFIWFEYVYDTAKLARERGLANVLVTNGIIEEEPLRELLPLIDAMNVDIKSMKDSFYRKLCKGAVGIAQRTVEIAFGRTHVEITNLVITGENDSDEDFEKLAEWAASVSVKLPVHVSRYFPAYRFDAPPTPLERLQRAVDILREKLAFVYVGNVDLPGGSDTVCPACGKVAIKRRGYYTTVVGLTDGRCSNCGEDLNVIR